jgi:sterol O-acyltransferase
MGSKRVSYAPLFGTAHAGDLSCDRNPHWSFFFQVMIMKMHSYVYVNGYLQWVDREAKKALEVLRKEAERVGGYETAIAVARIHKKEIDGNSVRSDSGSSTPDASNGHSGEKPYLEVEVSAAAVLRQRLAAAVASKNETVATEHATDITDETGPHPLVDHPDERIAELAQEFSELDSELVSTGPANVRWPNNISWSNFADYQLIPTLVYDLEYPRTEKWAPKISTFLG